MPGALEILTILAMSMVKFFFSPMLAHQLGYSFWETLVVTSLGGCLGTLLFYRMSGWIMQRARLRRIHREIAAQHSGPRERRRVFTRTNRFIVRVKRGHGMRGLAVITPPLISIPIGSIIAAKYFQHDRRTLPTLLSSVVFWSFVLTAAWTWVL